MRSPTRVFDRYVVYDKIAEGGMASVHVGRLVGPVGFSRTVAIKMMQPQFVEDREFVSMFVDEARVAARISHPNVVTTLDVVAEAGELLLVMEYVHGESLGRLIRATVERRERIPPGTVAAIMSGVLHGLHAAHEAKSNLGEPLDLVHRDVSPQNVLVGADGVARVLDFGVAKAVGRLQNTRTGQLKGKLAYMSPEQARGVVSRRTDVYAAAVVTWEALTGRRLFRGANEVEVLHGVLRGCSEPPSTYAPGLPRALDELTMRGLDRNPDQRFATAREMARAFEDAVPLASASRIGDWVGDVAKAALDERSRLVAQIERESPGQRTGGPTTGRHVLVAAAAPTSSRKPASLAALPATPAPKPADVPPDDDATIVTDPSTMTQMTAGSASAPAVRVGDSAGPKRRSSTAAAFWGAFAALLVLGLCAFLWRASGTLRTASRAAAAAPSPVSTPSAAPDPLRPAVEGVWAFPDPTSPAAAASGSTAPSASAARRR